MGEEEEAREGCVGVDLEDISVVAHCPEYDSDRGEVKGDSSPLPLPMIRKGGSVTKDTVRDFFFQTCRGVFSELIEAERELGQTELQTWQSLQCTRLKILRVSTGEK